jgi:CheY-like chemotaxis protein
MAVNALRKGTVLVVDDNRHVLTTVKMLLEDYFEKVVCTTYPAEIPDKCDGEAR